MFIVFMNLLEFWDFEEEFYKVGLIIIVFWIGEGFKVLLCIMVLWFVNSIE